MENPINYWYQKYIALKAKMDEMMKGVVKGFVATHLTSEGTKVTVNSGYLPKEFDIKNGDNVRIIIVKE